jgi:hypothetical protein
MLGDWRCCGQAGIRRDDRYAKAVGELDIDSIDQPQVMTQLPCSCEQRDEKVPFDRGLSQTLKPHRDLWGGEVSAAVETSECREYLGVEMCWGVQFMVP